MFEWDESKRIKNIAEHGIDFIDAAFIFQDETALLETVDDRTDYGEIRIRALGQVDNDWFIVVYTWRRQKRRIISAWKVNENGKRRYKNIFYGRAEKDA